MVTRTAAALVVVVPSKYVTTCVQSTTASLGTSSVLPRHKICDKLVEERLSSMHILDIINKNLKCNSWK